MTHALSMSAIEYDGTRQRFGRSRAGHHDCGHRYRLFGACDFARIREPVRGLCEQVAGGHLTKRF
jgi:hypothetical protein